MGVLLLENGDSLLLESGDQLLLEDGDTGAGATGDAGFVTVTVAVDATGLQRSVSSGRQSFDIGDMPVFVATFKYTATLALGDPDVVVFKWRTPDGTESTFAFGTNTEVDHVSTGVYSFTAPTIDASGDHWIRAKGTAGLVAAFEGRIGVRISQFVSP